LLKSRIKVNTMTNCFVDWSSLMDERGILLEFIVRYQCVGDIDYEIKIYYY
jgi:hypothetical protein